MAFKIESHNHPSRIVPYHGAATGVGGILRDVFIMNARPILLANYLCFGEPAKNPTAELVDGVVRGIGVYGNSIGVPTLTGQTEFHSSYNDNNIVNRFGFGLPCAGGESYERYGKKPRKFACVCGRAHGQRRHSRCLYGQ